MPVKLKDFLEKLASEKAPGPTPTFSALHLLYSLKLIAEGPIGRGRLATELKVGPGAIRTIIKRLKDESLIITSKAGCKLTSKGEKIWKEFKEILGGEGEIEGDKLINANRNFAILVRKLDYKVKSGIEQRDAAIKVGAKGAAVIIFKGERLIIPSVSDDVSKDFPKLAEQIIKLFKPNENDVIVVAGADDLHTARYGAMAAFWTLLED